MVNAGTAPVSLAASGAISNYVAGSITLTGGAVTLTAGTSIGSSGNVLDTSISSLTATASAGSIYVANAANPLTLTAAAKGAGNTVRVSNATGNMTLDGVSAPGQVTLSAGGSILDGNAGSTADITGSSATLTAGAAIGTVSDPVSMTVATLNSSSSSAGGAFLSNSGNLQLTALSATGGREIDIRLAP